ncbi:class I SAM-dependent methyltransferase [Silvanigrella aquatica]|uniref:Methyltransferase domain-containing protein n=1 Tax=Silvanigrella aquatica TaxID=1915309 RepID=A0A1L4D280_9BACT|nr:class I SAM-dependent methyltransferase [Silvanigrella aquatica]APJ04313.1 hypothetical protein AXG55_10505 [Silvanigrella aquatica]
MIIENNLSEKIFIRNLKDLKEIGCILESQWIEIQNGLAFSQLIIIDSFFKFSDFVNYIRNFFIKSNYHWGVHYYICESHSEFQIISFSNQNKGYLEKISKDYDLFLLNLHDNLYIKESLRSEIKSLKNFEFSTPTFISKDNFILQGDLNNSIIISDLFESKINVNEYNFFEAVHPAYSYQVVRIFNYLKKNNLLSTRFVDIGTGPGTALQMLLEILPSYSKIDVVEPSPVAFSYLKDRFKNNYFINLIQKSFLEYHPDYPLKLAISVGSSHHFNTYFLLQHAYKILDKEGYLIISDEFISPFHSVLERKKNLISHHMGYICDLMSLSIDILNLPISCYDDEIELIRLSNNTYPKIKLNILTDNLEISEKMCRELLNKLNHLIDEKMFLSNTFISYYRLCYLELQALVAGLDYIVECKTYVENLICMAEDIGFICDYHEKIYATSSGCKYQSGTHIVCFKKN